MKTAHFRTLSPAHILGYLFDKIRRSNLASYSYQFVLSPVPEYLGESIEFWKGRVSGLLGLITWEHIEYFFY